MRCALALTIAAVLAGSAHAGDDPVRLRLGTLAVDGSRYMQDILALAKEIEHRTRGSVLLEWRPNGQLGDDVALAKRVLAGTLDGGGFTETGLIAIAPEMDVWRYPGLFQTYDDVDRATAALDARIRELFDKRGTVFVMWADLGFAHVFSSARISSLRDVLLRAANWLPLPLDQTLTRAVANGSAKAWSLPPLFVLAMGAKPHSMSNLRYRYVVGGLVISRAAWARLDAEQQATVRDVCREWEPRLRARWRKETERGIAALRKAGLVIHVPTGAEVTAFLESSAKRRTEHATHAKIDELVALIVAAIEPRRD